MERNVVSDYLFFHHPVQMMAKNLKIFFALPFASSARVQNQNSAKNSQVHTNRSYAERGRQRKLSTSDFFYGSVSSLFLRQYFSPWQFARRKTLEFNYEANWVKSLSKRKLRWTCNACRMSLKIVILLTVSKMKPEIRRKVALWSRAEQSVRCCMRQVGRIEIFHNSVAPSHGNTLNHSREKRSQCRNVNPQWNVFFFSIRSLTDTLNTYPSLVGCHQMEMKPDCYYSRKYFTFILN